MKKFKIPKFSSYKDEAKFWDTHDTTQFLGEFKPAEAKFPKPRMKLISMRLPEPEINGLKKIAHRKGIGYLTLVRLWVTERYFKELKHAA